MVLGRRGFTYSWVLVIFRLCDLFADTGRVRQMWRVAPNRVGVFLK
jgi:hypothetical protein